MRRSNPPFSHLWIASLALAMTVGDFFVIPGSFAERIFRQRATRAKGLQLRSGAFL
jgi:hypothetical protein